jgi:hypothetical protein
MLARVTQSVSLWEWDSILTMTVRKSSEFEERCQWTVGIHVLPKSAGGGRRREEACCTKPHAPTNAQNRFGLMAADVKLRHSVGEAG